MVKCCECILPYETFKKKPKYSSRDFATNSLESRRIQMVVFEAASFVVFPLGLDYTLL